MKTSSDSLYSQFYNNYDEFDDEIFESQDEFEEN